MTDLSIYDANDVVQWFRYLDKLRKSGVTNMLGSGTFLVDEFGLSKEKAKEVLVLWMKSFDPAIPADRRARAVYVANGGTV